MVGAGIVDAEIDVCVCVLQSCDIYGIHSYPSSLISATPLNLRSAIWGSWTVGVEYASSVSEYEVC